MADENEDPDQISLVWTVDDVLTVAPGLTRDESREVLASVKRNHDATLGVNWDTIAGIASRKFGARACHPETEETLHDLCKHCDHFVEEDDGTHLCDEIHHNPDDHHHAEPRGEPKTLKVWRVERPDLFASHADGLIGPNSAHHKHPCQFQALAGD